MDTGAITGYVDVAQIVLYVFWIFFAGLVYYLHREDKREGYPLESKYASGRYPIVGFPPLPAPKTYRLSDGSTVVTPRVGRAELRINGTPSSAAVGSPLIPAGDPMLGEIGPGSYALRSDHPELTIDGKPLIIPMRKAEGFTVAEEDPNPIGMEVYGADKELGGVVKEIWVDFGEPQIRYLEVEVSTGRHVLLPIHYSKFDVERRRVNVRSILGSQFVNVPATASLEQVTMLEEEKITAYYSGGTLYATAARSEPLI